MIVPTASVPNDASLSNALARLRAGEASHLPDIVVPLSSTAWTPNGSLIVPDLGEVVVNEWAREQLSNLLGVRFDRWFQTASPEEQADEMTRRLQRARNKVRLRLAQGTCGPILRALVSPSYSAVQDSSLLSAVIDSLEGSSPRLHRIELTQRMTCVVVTVGEPQTAGGIVGALWGSLTIVNSGVGWSGLSVTLSIVRLVCKNGMSAPIHEAQVIRVRHRAIDMGAIQDQLGGKLKAVPEILSRAARTLEASTDWRIVNVEAEARERLREKGMIRNHLSGVLAAYRQEPHQSVFGISQAFTRHAQAVSPEARLALENLAGSYVARSAT